MAATLRSTHRHFSLLYFRVFEQIFLCASGAGGATAHPSSGQQNLILRTTREDDIGTITKLTDSVSLSLVLMYRDSRELWRPILSELNHGQN